MPSLVPGYTTEQKVSIVTATEGAINTEIDAQAPDGWIVTQLVLSGSDIVILFTRNVEDVLP
jgi:hypothetical protein